MRVVLFLAVFFVSFSVFGQRIARIGPPSFHSQGSSSATTFHVVSDNFGTKVIKSDSVTLVLGFLTPHFNSLSTPTQNLQVGLLKVYPNPFGSFIRIENPFEGLYSYQVLDMHGRHLSSGVLSGLVNQLPLPALMTGMYLLKIRHPDAHVELYKITKLQ